MVPLEVEETVRLGGDLLAFLFAELNPSLCPQIQQRVVGIHGTNGGLGRHPIWVRRTAEIRTSKCSYLPEVCLP